MARYYDNLQGFSDLKTENGQLYGRQNGGQYVLIPTKGDPGNPGRDGVDGSDGDSAYVYCAFADDSAGTGFTLIDDGTKAWTSWITTTTPITSPSLADFTVWVKRKGTDGRDSYTYVAWASDSSGTGFSLVPSTGLPYRAELHSDHVIASPSLADFSGIPFVNIGGGSSYTFNSPLSVDANNVVSINLTGYLPKNNPTATGTLNVPTLSNGYACYASVYSHAEGDYTNAYGYCSHAEGCYARTSGMASHAEGYETSANSDFQHVEGKYNILDSAGIYALIIGNGTGEKELRSNALTVSWTGNLWVSGNVEDGAGNILSNMAKKDLSNLSSHTTIDTSTPVDFVIKYVAGSTSWYRIWKSGWVEQGGRFAGKNQATEFVITLPVNMLNTNWFISTGVWDTNTTNTVKTVHVTARTTSSFKALTPWVAASASGWHASSISWYICGQGDPTAIAAILQGE